jgi:hypothetical protein
MKSRSGRKACGVLLLCALLAGCGDGMQPPDERAGAQNGDQERVTAAGLSFFPDSAWIRQTARGMRAAQFLLPGGDAGESAELVVFFFGVGGGGSVEANIDRWCGQLVQADGRNSRDVARVETRRIGELNVTTVHVSGRYTADPMPGMAPTKIQGEATMLAAIVEGEGGPWYFKALGATPTIERWEASFEAMLESLRLVRDVAARPGSPMGGV